VLDVKEEPLPLLLAVIADVDLSFSLLVQDRTHRFAAAPFDFSGVD
jgi:hypothetical protein